MTTIYTYSGLTDNDTGDEGITVRTQMPITGASLGQVRVTFKASNTAAATLHLDHASIGVRAVADGQTAATPVELTFTGAHGFTLANAAGAQTIVSDWVNLSALATDLLVVIIDFNASDGGNIAWRNNTATGCTSIYHAAAASYTSTTVPSGSTTMATTTHAVSLIETQAGGATTLTATALTAASPVLGTPIATMLALKLGDAAIDGGLTAIKTNANQIYVCTSQPTDYADAVTKLIGAKNLGAGNVLGTIAAGSPSGRIAATPAVTNGVISTNGTPTAWAIVDSVNSVLYASGLLTGGVAMITTDAWTLDAITLHMNK